MASSTELSHRLKNHVVQTRAVIGVSDVHARAFTDSLKVF